MIIKLNKKEEEICRKFLEVKENNISAAEFYIDYLNNCSNEITSFDIKMLSNKYDIDKSFYKAMLKKMRVKENDSDYARINENSNIKNVKQLDPNDYINDEFAKTIGFPKVRSNDWMLTKLHYLAYEGFVYNELKIDVEFYKEETPLGFFTSDIPYLAVIEGDQIWMSVIPHEINTMKEPIRNAFGNVLVLGLGLGYYAFHVSNKDNVTDVTIIEKDEKAIHLFKEYILPKFPHKNKITIIHEDAFVYFKSMNEFDYVFSDIWHNVGDGLGLYLRIKPLELIYKNTKFDYWIETSLLAMLRRQLLTVYEENLYGGLTEKDYLKANNQNDLIINALYFKTKDVVISSSDNLRQLISDESLKKIAQELLLKR